VRLPDPDASRIVLIGTSEYEDERWPPLLAVRQTIEELARAFIDEDTG